MLELLMNRDVKPIKESEDILVAEGCDCFYKVREFDPHNPRTKFELIVAKAYAEELQSVGLMWKLDVVEVATMQFLVEKRQKLEIPTPSKCSFDDLLRGAYAIQRRVENKLGLPSLLAQLKNSGGFEHVDKIVLARKHVENYSDFGLWNGNVIRLGNSNPVLALRDDASGKWIDDFPTRPVHVNLPSGDYWFTSDKMIETNFLIGEIGCQAQDMWLFTGLSDNFADEIESCQVEYKKMLEDNLDIRMKGQTTDARD